MINTENKSIVKKAAFAALPLILAPSLTFAAGTYDRARVVGVEAVYETVSYEVPVKECRMEQVAYRHGPEHRASATGPILGAIIGGALGNAVGHKKRNKQVGTAVGALLGGSIGADIARQNRYHRGASVEYRNEQVCNTVSEYRSEEQLLGYDVRYRYAGKTYQTRMPRDPGDSIRVRVHVSPVGQ
jgi:uncharacterized protein YcfJ